MTHARLSALFAAVLVAGCGGGGGWAGVSPFPPDSAPSPSAAPAPRPAPAPTPAPSPIPAPLPPSSGSEAEGFYGGTLNVAGGNYNLNVAILENGEFWGVYSRGGVIYGAVHGVSSSTSGSFSGSGSDYYLTTRSRTDGSFAGTFVPKASISGTTLPNRNTFSASYDASYDVPASLGQVTGTWAGSIVSPAGQGSVRVTISTTGNFSGNANGCTYSGSVTPRASGKAVFDLIVSFGPAPCVFAGQSLSGLSVVTGGGGSLLTLALLPDGSNGFLWLGRKQ